MKTRKKIQQYQLTNEFPGYYVDKGIKEMLDRGKKAVLENDWDRVYIIDGNEGSGKSLLALQLGYYLDPTLNLDRVVFNGEDFAKAITEAKKHQCIIFDEAFNGLSSAGSLSKLNRLITRKLMECRQKNLFIFIVLPTIFLLQKYASIFRSKALFHVYAQKDGKRGFYKIYNSLNKKLLVLLGSKLYSYSKPFIKNRSRFGGIYPIDEKAYREKKLKSVEDRSDEPEDHKWMIQRDLAIYYLIERMKVKQIDLSKFYKSVNYPLERTTIGEIVKKTSKNSHLSEAII